MPSDAVIVPPDFNTGCLAACLASVCPSVVDSPLSPECWGKLGAQGQRGVFVFALRRTERHCDINV